MDFRCQNRTIMQTTKILNDEPAPGCAILERATDSFLRTRNGAWVSGWTSVERFEIPLADLNSPAGSGWLNPGRCGGITARLPDGSYLTVSGASEPIHTHGFGEYGTLRGDVRVNRPHPLLPNLAVTYARIEFFADEILATFRPRVY